MRSGKKIYLSVLYLIAAFSGISLFITAWNSFLLEKINPVTALVFLFFLLVSLLLLFLRTYTLFREPLPTDSSEPKEFSAEIQHNTGETPVPKQSVNLLKSVFTSSDPGMIGEKLLKNLAKEFEIVQGVFFALDPATGRFIFKASYACFFESVPPEFAPGEGISGQAAADARIIALNNLPESYLPVLSGLGSGKANCLYSIPLVYEKKTLAIVEISCFKKIPETGIALLNNLASEGGRALKPVIIPEKS